MKNTSLFGLLVGLALGVAVLCTCLVTEGWRIWLPALLALLVVRALWSAGGR